MVLFPGGSPGFAEVPWGPLLESTEDCSAGPNSLGDANPEIRLRWGRVGVHGPRSDDGAGGSKHSLVNDVGESSVVLAGLPPGPRGSCGVNTWRSAGAPVSVVITKHSRVQKGAVSPLGWRTSCDERERSRQEVVVAGTVVDGPVSEAVCCAGSRNRWWP